MRNYDQFIRFYNTFLKVRGSYIQASYLDDPEVIEEMCAIPEKEWQKIQPPPLFGWTNVMDRLTDIGDQLIAQRVADPKKVKFYPRPKMKAAEERRRRNENRRDDLIEQARQRNAARRRAHMKPQGR